MGLFAAIILLVAAGCICKSNLNEKRAEREAAGIFLIEICNIY